MFPLTFPQRLLAQHPSTSAVLDPFCGRGTTLYASRLAGVRTVGIDISPVAAAIAAAKLRSVSVASVVGLCRRLVKSSRHDSFPKGQFWTWAYHERTLRDLLAVREGLQGMGNEAPAVMLRAVMLGILHGPRNKGLPSYLSNQMPRTFASKPDYSVRYWSERGLVPDEVDLLNVVTRRAEYLLGHQARSVGGKVVLGDAAETLKHMRRDTFDLVVTSPPYYGMRTYVADQWLRGWFLGGPERPVYESSTQIAHAPSQDAFAASLGEVWSATAERCRRGAHLAIRFGGLPSARTNPAALIVKSIEASGAGWSVRRIDRLPEPARQRRQAEQFIKPGRTVEEYDVTAVLV